MVCIGLAQLNLTLSVPFRFIPTIDPPNLNLCSKPDQEPCAIVTSSFHTSQ